MPCRLVLGGFPNLLFDRLSSITHDVELALLPSEGLERCWVALWLRVQPLLCFMLELSAFDYKRCKWNILPNVHLESF